MPSKLFVLFLAIAILHQVLSKPVPDDEEKKEEEKKDEEKKDDEKKDDEKKDDDKKDSGGDKKSAKKKAEDDDDDEEEEEPKPKKKKNKKKKPVSEEEEDDDGDIFANERKMMDNAKRQIGGLFSTPIDIGVSMAKLPGKAFFSGVKAFGNGLDAGLGSFTRDMWKC